MNEEKAKYNFQKYLRRYFPTHIKTIAGGITFRRECLFVGTKVPDNKL